MTTTTQPITRGEFLKVSATAGSALVLGFHLPLVKALSSTAPDTSFSPNIWLSIEPSGEVVITAHRAELGQKTWTSLPRIVAEELEADWEQVRVVHGNFNPAFGGQVTGGSASVRTSYDKLRMAGATALALLKSAAAKKWGVNPSTCSGVSGYIRHQASGRELSYGELTTLATAEEIPDNIELKDPANFKLIGQSVKSIEAASRVRGSAIYGLDFALPEMLYATTVHCPVFGGKVESINDQAARKIAGVKQIIEISSGVAVVGTDSYSVISGAKALDIAWDKGDFADKSSADISRDMHGALDQSGEELRNDGNVQESLAKAANVIESTYEVPYLDHAPIEPVNCTAWFKGESCEIWAPTQNPESAYKAAEYVTGLSGDAIQVNMLYAGGAFGRKLAYDYVAEAVEISKVLRKPVKLFWSRSEDIQHGQYRPTSVHRLAGAVNGQGRPIAWSHKIAGPVQWAGYIAGGAGELPYAIDNVHVEAAMFENPVPYGPLRSVGNTQTAYANECFMDELAEAAKVDPYQFRRGLLTDHPHHLAVLDLAAEKADWGNPGPGIFQGIAVHASFHSYAAVVAEISLSDNGKIKLERMVGTIDCGTVVNPWGVEHQIEGGIIFALSLACHSAITLKNGAVEQTNYHNYKLLKMGETPKVEVHIVPSTEQPTGVGEPPVPPTAPALVNAIYAATGKRIYELPLTKHGLI
jgi:CO/xanthine dehydrogenase Mo-binding subunit